MERSSWSAGLQSTGSIGLGESSGWTKLVENRLSFPNLRWRKIQNKTNADDVCTVESGSKLNLFFIKSSVQLSFFTQRSFHKLK